jgi:anaerobic selenocysteine-containing dehydrogenase
MAEPTGTQRIHGYCGLCRASCGTVATVENGRFTRLDPDPAHPTGQAICAKGRAAPELVYHPERLTHPLRRTRPKGEADPGWERISWDMALDFYAHADLFMTPTAALADIVLPVASAFEREALKIGFEISTEAQALVQFRQAIVPPPGEARGDTEIVVDLAERLGLAAQFWDGNSEAAYRHQLAPTGITPEQLRAQPEGVRVLLQMRYAKHAAPDAHGHPRGFATPSRRIEFYSETFLEHGYAPLPDFVEPAIGPVARPDLVARFPLVLTCAKSTLFCQSQHRALPSLRKRAPDPTVTLHPEAARARRIAQGDWVAIDTPQGSVRARACLNADLDPRVVVGEHGWWQGCAALGAPAYDPFGPEGANFNLLIGSDTLDPVSGTASHRAYLCEIRKLAQRYAEPVAGQGSGEEGIAQMQ